MQRHLLLTAALLVAGGLPAQQADNGAPPLYRQTYIHLGGVFVPPLAGAPFSASALIENRQLLPDGSVQTRRTVNLIGRDSRGRIHGENRSMVPDSFQGLPQLVDVHIYDPQTRLSFVYNLATHIAQRQVQREPSQPGETSPPSNPNVTIEDLGSTTIDGIDVKGTRRTLLIPAQVSGTGAPLAVVDEYWYSADLHVNLLLRHNDPRTGIQTVAFSGIKREDPPPAFFQVPQGYKIVDMTPPPGAPVDRAKAAGSPVR